MYSRATIIDRLVLRAGVDTVEKRALFEDLAISCEDFIYIQTSLLVGELSDAVGSIVLQMCLELYNQVKSEGYQNETVEGITIRYGDVFEKYTAPLRRFRKLRTL